MGLRNILVHVDVNDHSDVRVSVASKLAHQQGAFLTGLYVLGPERADIALPIDLHYGGATVADSETRMLIHESAAQVRFVSGLRAADARGEWRVAYGNPKEVIPHWGRHVDLVVVGQSDPEDILDTSSLIAVRTLLESGRPVLVVPYAGRFETVGTNVVVAWKNTRESVRALNDAIPLMRGAAQVTVLSVNAPWGNASHQEYGDPAAIATHLFRHGIEAEVSRLDSAEDLTVGDLLLNRCFDIGADLLVAGGFGHSQLHERVLGGVTRTLLETMTLPVFMSH
jgi:nucleotide-binding universal stress UspA family protein